MRTPGEKSWRRPLIKRREARTPVEKAPKKGGIKWKGNTQGRRETRATPSPINENGDVLPSIEEMRADLERAGYGETLRRFMDAYPNISGAKAVEMFHAVY